MEFFPKPLDRAESDAFAARIREGFESRGFGQWAVEVPGRADFIGYVGLSVPQFEAHFTPCVEIGWRLAREQWGSGYASEAARGSPRLRLPKPWARSNRIVHCPGQLESAPGHGTNRNVRNAPRRFRSSGASRGPPATSSCPLPDQSHRFWAPSDRPTEHESLTMRSFASQGRHSQLRTGSGPCAIHSARAPGPRHYFRLVYLTSMNLTNSFWPSIWTYSFHDSRVPSSFI